MWLLAVRTLRFRKGGFAGTFVAMVLATAIVLACGSLMETGIRVTVPPQRLEAAAIVVVGDRSYRVPGTDESADLAEQVRIPAGLLDEVERVPGVGEAVGESAFPVVVVRDGRDVNPTVATFGHGWSSVALAPYTLVAGQPPRGPGDVVLDAALERRSGATVGDRVEMVIRGDPGAYRVAGVVEPPSRTTQAAVFFTDARAELLSGHPGEFDSIGIFTVDEADVASLAERIGSALRGRAVVTLTGDERGLAEFPEARASGETLVVLSAVFGGMAVLVAMLVVASMLGLSILLRQRELALLRAIGATPRQLRRMILAETLIVSLSAISLGSVAGVYLGRWLFRLIAERGLVSEALVYRRGWVPATAAAGVALLAALTVAIVAGRRAAQTPPTQALVEADIQRRWLTAGRLILALLFLGGGVALVVATMAMSGPIAASTAAPTVILFAIALALLGPGVARATIGALQWPMRIVPGVAGYLGLLNARARTVRMAGVIVPIMLATGVATAELYLQTTQMTAAEQGFTENVRADAVLTSSTAGLPRDVVDAVRAIPAVGGASAFVSSTGFVEVPRDRWQGEDGWPLLGLSAKEAAGTTAVAMRAGTLGALRDNGAALSVDHARELGRGLGDTIRLRLGDRALVELRIVALFVARPGFDVILMPADTLAAHTTSGLPSQILVRGRPGVDPAALIPALRRLAARWPGVEVAAGSGLAASLVEEQQIQAWVNFLLIGVLVAYTGIALVNTLIIVTGERRREFGIQRLIGSTRGQVIRMMLFEAVLAALAGILLGTVISATTLMPFSLAVSDTPLPSGPIWIYLAIVATAIGLTLVFTFLPTWLVTRVTAVRATAA